MIDPKGIRMNVSDGAAARVLIVEDDTELWHLVISYLETQNMCAMSASNRIEMTQHFLSQEPNLVLLDLRLDKDDGLDLLRHIRSRSTIPVIITTGDRQSEIDRVVGLELGADDYVTKPFSLRELLARMRAVLRRHNLGRLASQRDRVSARYRFDGWQLDRRTRRVLNRDGGHVSLSNNEYALLLALLQAAGQPLTREQLLHATRVHEDIFDRSIDVQVLRLRRKLEADPSTPRIIQTARGIGYWLAVPVELFQDTAA
jgi:DNA-binding response OmpR family regulator